MDAVSGGRIRFSYDAVLAPRDMERIQDLPINERINRSDDAIWIATD